MKATDAASEAQVKANEAAAGIGALNDLTAPPDADLDRQLSAGATKADVDVNFRR